MKMFLSSCLFVLCLLSSLSLFAQRAPSATSSPSSTSLADDPGGDDCQINTLSLNTGINHATGQLYTVPTGVNANALVRDPYWTVTQFPSPNIPAGSTPWVIPHVPVHWDNSAPVTARWLSALRTNRYPFNHSDPFRFERCFCLSEEGDVDFDLTVYGDDAITSVTVDGASLYNNPTATGPHFGTGQGVQINQTVFLTAGKKCLEVQLQDIFRDRAGFKVEGNVNSPHLKKEECCDPRSSIGGYKFFDQNGNGIWDNNEGALPNWPIILNNGLATTTTNIFGYYSFDNLPPAIYSVSEGQQAGYTQTYPANGQSHLIALGQFEAATLNFGNTLEVPPPPSSEIIGKKFYDLNCDGIRDPNEPLLKGWGFDLYTDGSTPYLTAISDENGCFSFSNLPAGFYTIRERVRPGWQVSTPAGGVLYLDVLDQTSYEIEFGNCLINDPDACCEENEENEKYRVNFEFNPNFYSHYYNGPMATPGTFTIFTAAGLAAASNGVYNVQGYNSTGNCNPNDKFLAINGRTGQSGERIIYQTPAIQAYLEDGKKYSICVPVKHLPSCAFDVVPKVRVAYRRFDANGNYITLFQGPLTTINSGSGACDYHVLTGTFTWPAFTNPQTDYDVLSIFLDETGVGDGNDLVIDEIAIQEIPQLNVTAAQFDLVRSPLGTGTYNLTATPRDPLGTDCEATWEVYAVDVTVDPDAPLPGSYMSDSSWGVSTDFPRYNSSFMVAGEFRDNITYVIRRTVDCPCQEQVTYEEPYIFINSEPMGLQEDQPGGEKAFSDKFPAVFSTKDQELSVMPNPFATSFRVIFPSNLKKGGVLRAFNMAGRQLKSIPYSPETPQVEIDLSTYPAGTYLLQTTLKDKVVTQKVIKQ